MKNQKKDFVKERYSQVAKDESSCCPSSVPCCFDVIEQAKNIGYSEEELYSSQQQTLDFD